MKVIIAGSRNITDMKFVEKATQDFLDPETFDDLGPDFKITEVVCGEAKGVDQLGKQWAIENSIPVKSFPADWDKYGKSAGYRRNEEMAEYADALIAVLYCTKNAIGVYAGTKGTTHMIETAKEKNMKYYIYYVYPEDLNEKQE